MEYVSRWLRSGNSTPPQFIWKHPNAGAVCADLKQCEAKRILLGTEHAADKPLPVLRNPITSPVLGDLKMVRGQYR